MCGYWTLEELAFLFNFYPFKFEQAHVAGYCVRQHNSNHAGRPSDTLTTLAIHPTLQKDAIALANHAVILPANSLS